MKPQDKKAKVIDGTHPSEGGEIEVEHTLASPGDTVKPDGASGLKQFDDHFIEDVEKANNYEDIEPEQISETPTQIQQGPQDVNQQAVVAAKNVINPESSSQQLAPPNASQPVYNVQEQMQTGVYSTDPTMVSGVGQQDVAMQGGQAPITPIVSGDDRDLNNLNAVKPKKKSSKARFMFPIIVIMVLLIGSAGYVFGIYLPNTPENVWKTGLNRTGQQMNALIEKLENPQELNTYEQTKIVIAGQADINGQVIDINFDSIYSDAKSDSNLDVKSAGQGIDELSVNADIITELPEDADYPNVYFKIAGLSEFGLDLFFPELNKYDDKWIAIEQDFWEIIEDQILSSQIQLDEDGNQAAEVEITYEDYVSIIKDVNEVMQQYLFTANPEYAILQLQEFVKTEQSQGINANHYKAVGNTANAKKLCIAFGEKIYTNQAYKKILNQTDAQIDRLKIEFIEDCQGGISEESFAEPLDIWMDKKYKLFHKLRLTNSNEATNSSGPQGQNSQNNYQVCMEQLNDASVCEQWLSAEPTVMIDGSTSQLVFDQEVELKEQYTDIGQVYKGGDDWMFFVDYNEESNLAKNNTKLQLDINIDTLAVKGELTVDASNDTSTNKVGMTITSEPYTGDINTAKPANAIPMSDMLEDLFGVTQDALANLN